MADTMAEWVDRLLPSAVVPAATKYDPQTGVILQMRGFPARNGDVAFDSYLILHKGRENHTLTLVLKVHLRQMLPQSSLPMLRIPTLDSDIPPRVFLVKPWQGADWAHFVKGFKQECAKWKNQFWLIPPVDFSKLDISAGQQAIRPNVYCNLEVEVVGAPAGAHRTIDVVNLDTRFGGGFFRSDANRYTSSNAKVREQATQDANGHWHTVKNFSTIVHEIGHALGLPHIGVTHQDHNCQFAVLLDQNAKARASLPALFKGGSNAPVCYGTLGLPSRGANVMGGGTKFEDSNAAPWVKRLALHTATRPQDWKVSKKVAPKMVAPRQQYYQQRFNSVSIGG
jgi:hypothetical protein